MNFTGTRYSPRKQHPASLSDDRISSTGGIALIPSPPESMLTEPVKWVNQNKISKPQKDVISKGFDQFRAALQKLLESLDEPLLQRKWEIIRQHLESFHNESIGSRVTDYCHKLLQEDRNEVSNTMLMCYLLLCLLCRYHISFKPIVTRVTERILALLFIIPPTVVIDEEYPEDESTYNQLAECFDEKTYCHALRDLSKKLTDNTNQAEDEIRKKNKMLTILQRVISYWQTAFCGRILAGWRVYNKACKREDHLNNLLELKTKEVETLKITIAQLECSREASVVEYDEKINNLNLKCALEKKNRESDLQARDKLITELRGDIELLSGKAVVAQMLQSDITKLQEVTVSALYSGVTSWEHDLQQELIQFRNRLTPVPWMVESISKHCSDVTKKLLSEILDNPPSNLDSEIHFLDLTTGLLQSIAPNLVPDPMVKDIISDLGLFDKSVKLLKLLSTLGILVGEIDPEDLTLQANDGNEARFKIINAIRYRICTGPGSKQPAFKDSPDANSVKDDDKSPLCMIPTAIGDWETLIQRRKKDLISLRDCGGEITTQQLKGPPKSTAPELTRREKAEQADYVDDFDTEAIADLLPQSEATDTTEESTSENGNEEAAIKQVIRDNYRVLRNVYLYYGTSDVKTTDRQIDRSEFQTLLQDCGVKVTKKSLNAIWNKSNNAESNEDTTLSPSEYVTALVRCCGVSSKSEPGKLSSKFTNFVQSCVVSQANYASVEEFRQLILNKKIQQTLNRNRTNIGKVFQYYASKEGVSKKSDATTTISFSEFRDFVSDLKMIDETCTHVALRHMFLNLQDDPVDNNPTLDLSEFIDVLCGLSCFKYPAPYIPLEQKVKNFMRLLFGQGGNIMARLRMK